ncbi:unnamed protein product [Effrenium voratum]|nr:unnamed protein product [Effrenium voratum]
MRLNAKLRIRGARCELVPYQRWMVPIYHSWMQDPELLELTASEPLSLEEEYEMQQSWQDSEDKITFILLDPDLGDTFETQMVGDVNVFYVAEEEQASLYQQGEIEVMVAKRSCRRKGLAREALKLLQAFCGRELGTRRFVAKIKEHNEASIALFESLGYQLLKRVEVFGEVHYSLELSEPEDVPATILALERGHLYPDGHLWWAASMFGGMFLLCAVMALAMSLQDSLLVVSLAVCATTLWASCAWSASIWALSWTYSWKVAAAWALVAAQALLFFLEPLCGPRGHAHCYEHCPFGAGKHQFFAFDLTLVGLILLGGCQSFDPDAFTERRSPASGPGLEKSDAV